MERLNKEMLEIGVIRPSVSLFFQSYLIGYQQIRMKLTDVHRIAFKTHEGRMEAEHMRHLRIILKTFREHQLYANLKKCSFAQSRVEYLMHVVTEAGEAVDQSKIETMLNCPLPTSLKELRGFLVFTGYYRKFIRVYDMIAWPHMEQLKKYSFKWGKAKTRAFEQLKMAMTSAPIVALSDFSRSYATKMDMLRPC
ncbi:uncharacterized protein LOC110019309 [Phalaenopsis equestris]|uniref:uncharacterized protein LOC110019309 n=1 Tax=Phalaenopsis equestris TaxID=78828 RepID=UPI0009E3A59A|nr:uncharacterized protein LOC110019309 [Phalaenopsis equestris]